VTLRPIFSPRAHLELREHLFRSTIGDILIDAAAPGKPRPEGRLAGFTHARAFFGA
jgi:hypothetical protein